MTLHIRTYRQADEAAVISLWQDAGLVRPWNSPADDIAGAVKARDAALLVGLSNDQIVATVMVGYDGHRGWIYYLCVSESCRGRGHGREMMLEAELWLQARKAPKVQLMVRTGNQDAAGFYQALGYDVQTVSVLGKWFSDEEALEGAVSQGAARTNQACR